MMRADEGSDVPGESQVSASQSYVRAGLELLDLEATDAEIAVIEAVDALYRPLVRGLLDAELDGIPPEPGTDVSGPPGLEKEA